MLAFGFPIAILISCAIGDFIRPWEFEAAATCILAVASLFYAGTMLDRLFHEMSESLDKALDPKLGRFEEFVSLMTPDYPRRAARRMFLLASNLEKAFNTEIKLQQKFAEYQRESGLSPDEALRNDAPLAIRMRIAEHEARTCRDAFWQFVRQTYDHDVDGFGIDPNTMPKEPKHWRDALLFGSYQYPRRSSDPSV